MPSSSRYLATVRRAIVMPLASSWLTISWSLSGAALSSPATRSAIISLTLVLETDAPLSAW